MRVLWLGLLAACEASTTPKMTDAPIVVTACSTESDCAGGDTPYCDPNAGVCVECRFDSHCGVSVCESNQCHPASSCKALHAALPGLPTGLYSIDPDGSGANAPANAYCDMTTDGGGWTALLNPTSLPSTRNPDLQTSTTVVSGTQSCAISTVPQELTANGWNALLSYACGDVTFQLDLNWPNPSGATEVAFVAVLQGETTRTLTVNGTALPADATTTDGGGATCVFYNGTSASTSPALNECHNTFLDAPRRKVTFAGDLALRLTTGPACAPTCSHGTGMNIYKLLVR